MIKYVVAGKSTEFDTCFVCRFVDSSVFMDSRLPTETDENQV